MNEIIRCVEFISKMVEEENGGGYRLNKIGQE
jgi:hypothetical protein